MSSKKKHETKTHQTPENRQNLIEKIDSPTIAEKSIAKLFKKETIIYISAFILVLLIIGVSLFFFNQHRSTSKSDSKSIIQNSPVDDSEIDVIIPSTPGNPNPPSTGFCDYSDIMTPEKINTVFDKISNGKLNEITSLLPDYLNPLNETSSSPYKDEKIWIQNFNNMQKILDPKYLNNLMEVMRSIKEAHQSLQRLQDDFTKDMDDQKNTVEKNRILSAELAQINEKLNNLNNNLSKLEDDILTKETQKSETDSDVKNLQKQLEEIVKIEQEKILNFQIQINQLKQLCLQKEKQRNEREAKKHKLEEVQKQIDDLQQSINEKAHKIKELDQISEKDHEQINLLNHDIDKLKKKIRRYTYKLDLRLGMNRFKEVIKELIDTKEDTSNQFKEYVKQTKDEGSRFNVTMHVEKESHSGTLNSTNDGEENNMIITKEPRRESESIQIPVNKLQKLSDPLLEAGIANSENQFNKTDENNGFDLSDVENSIKEISENLKDNDHVLNEAYQNYNRLLEYTNNNQESMRVVPILLIKKKKANLAIEKLANDIKNLNKSIDKNNHQKLLLNEWISIYLPEMDEKQQRQEQLQKAIDELEVDPKQEQDKINSIETEIVKHKKLINNAEKKHARDILNLKEKVGQLLNEIKEVNAEKDKIKNEIEQTENQAKEVHQKLTDLMNKDKMGTDLPAFYKKKIEDKRAKLVKLNRKFVGLWISLLTGL